MSRRIARCSACGDLAHSGVNCYPHKRDLRHLDELQKRLDNGPHVTPERARAIWAARGPMGGWPAGSHTLDEDQYITAVWYTLSGDTSWASALMLLMNAETEKP